MLFLVNSVDDQKVQERANEVLFLMSHLFSFEVDVCAVYDHHSNQMENCCDMCFILDRSESRGIVCESVHFCGLAFIYFV